MNKFLIAAMLRESVERVLEESRSSSNARDHDWPRVLQVDDRRSLWEQSGSTFNSAAPYSRDTKRRQIVVCWSGISRRTGRHANKLNLGYQVKLNAATVLEQCWRKGERDHVVVDSVL